MNRNRNKIVYSLGIALLSSVLLATGTTRLVASREAISPPENPPHSSAALQTRDQVLPAGIRWQQRYVAVGNTRFPVYSLEMNLRDSRVALRPIWSNSAQMSGTRPLVEMGRQWRTFAAINGGFFNRKNRLPLGAIRRENRWFSGPILNRGAIAWDDAGNVQIGRLYLRETAISQTGQRVFLTYLNSGYVQAGMARYTSEWGRSYQPLTDNEAVITVQNNQVMRHDRGGASGQGYLPIPSNGYLLVIRAGSTSPALFPVGSRVTLQSETLPATFAQFPHIMGAGPLLLENGRVVLNPGAEKFSAAFNGQAASRSFIGQTRQGTLMMAVVHSRPNGRGPTLRELAALCQNLGLVSALNLDGGSSSSLFLNGTLVDRNPSTAARVHNGIGVYVPQ